MAAAIGMWVFCYLMAQATIQKFTTADYETRKAILRINPKISKDKDGAYIELDRSRNLTIRASSLFSPSYFKADQFLNDVHAGDTIWYTIRKEEQLFSQNDTNIVAVGKPETTYLALAHLAKYDKW